MLDLGFVRANLELVEEKLRARGADPAALLGDFRALDEKRRAVITIAEQGKALLNQLSQEVGERKRTKQDVSDLMVQIVAAKEALEVVKKNDPEIYNEQMRAVLANIPNLTRDEVPPGKSETDNVVVKTHLADSAQRTWDFTPKPHWEIGEALGILDLERAAKLSGARFAVYIGAGARLERALINFMLDLHTTKHGYTEVLPPFMVNGKSLFPGLPPTLFTPVPFFLPFFSYHPEGMIVH